MFAIAQADVITEPVKCTKRQSYVDFGYKCMVSTITESVDSVSRDGPDVTYT